MFKAVRELVFIEINEGVGKDSGKPYKVVKLGDPVTFENYKLNADPESKLVKFTKGEKVLPTVGLVDFFGRTQVQLLDLQPAAK